MKDGCLATSTGALVFGGGGEKLCSWTFSPFAEVGRERDVLVRGDEGEGMEAEVGVARSLSDDK